MNEDEFADAISEEEILDESIFLDILIKGLRSLEMKLASNVRKSDPNYAKIAQGFDDLKSLIASASQ